MRTILISIILVILALVLISCGNKVEQQDGKSSKVPISNNDTLYKEDKNTLSVKIISNSDLSSFSRVPITLTSESKGVYDKELQYHWILENDNDFEGFFIPENGPQKEIINSGEPVELELFAEVSWVERTLVEFKVKLQVEDKETSDIIATDEIIIENHAGIYNVK